MQETRQQILEILKNRQEATVGDIVNDLCDKRDKSITAVTVRHHLTILEREELIESPQLRHKNIPGRPQHIYRLTQKASAHLPNNYQQLALLTIEKIRASLPDAQVNVILEGVADMMAGHACIDSDLPLPRRLEKVTCYLNDHGYEAYVEAASNGFMLFTRNCPYHHISHRDPALCQMDMRLIASMLGVVPRMMAKIAGGDEACSYFIPYEHSTET